jgi:hypothetical protein
LLSNPPLRARAIALGGEPFADLLAAPDRAFPRVAETVAGEAVLVDESQMGLWKAALEQVWALEQENEVERLRNAPAPDARPGGPRFGRTSSGLLDESFAPTAGFAGPPALQSLRADAARESARTRAVVLRTVEQARPGGLRRRARDCIGHGPERIRRSRGLIRRAARLRCGRRGRHGNPRGGRIAAGGERGEEKHGG